MTINPRAQRALLLVGMVMSTVYGAAFYFLLDFWPPPSPMLSAAEVVELYAHSNSAFRAGVVLMIVTGSFWMAWAVVIGVQMARDEQGTPIWAITQAFGSTVGTALFLSLSPLIWGMAAFSVDRAPELTVMLNECAWLTFITAASFLPFQTFPVAVVAFSKKKDEANSAFPRWLGWLSLFMGICAEVGAVAQMFKVGPFAWNGLFTFYLPVIVYGAWMGAITFTLIRAISRQENAALAS